jgi:hypothetical protein
VKKILRQILPKDLIPYSAEASSGFSTAEMAAFCIGIRQFLLLPNASREKLIPKKSSHEINLFLINAFLFVIVTLIQ